MELTTVIVKQHGGCHKGIRCVASPRTCYGSGHRMGYVEAHLSGRNNADQQVESFHAGNNGNWGDRIITRILTRWELS